MGKELERSKKATTKATKKKADDAARSLLGRFIERLGKVKVLDPAGGRVPAAALARHLSWWRRFLTVNAEHPEVRAVVGRIDRLISGNVPDAALALSWRDHRVPRGTREQLKRLREAGFTGVEILPRLGALNRLAFSEHRRDIGVLETDDRLTVALGRAFVRSRSRTRHAPEVSGTICLALGRHLRSALAPLFASVELGERERRKRRSKEGPAEESP